MGKVLIFCLAALTISCKARTGSDSETKATAITNDSTGTVDLLYPAAWNRVPGNDLNVAPPVITENGEAKGDPNNEPAAAKIENVCWQRCQKSEHVVDENNEPAAMARCELIGHSNALGLINQGGKLSEAAQNIITNAFVDSVETISSEDQGAAGALIELQPLFTKSDETKKICQPERPEGLGLTRLLYQTRVYVNNKTNYWLKFEAESDILTSSGYFERTGWLPWNIAPNSNEYLSHNGGNVFGGMTYKISKDGKVFKNNGKGIYFNSSGQHTITITNADINGGGSSGQTSGGSSGSTSASVNTCVAVLNKVYNRYPTGNAQFSGDRNTEVKGCWGAAKDTDWTNLMKAYYCEHPGVPVRKCFTYGAKGLKEIGYSQKNAYNAMFSLCSANGSFATMSSDMLANFREIMVHRYSTGDDVQCIKKFGRL